MGRGATNTLERLATSLGGKAGADLSFQSCADVPNGGVLFALPALLVQGLLDHTDEHFELSKGYYALSSIFLLIAFLALARVKFVEGLKHEAPGEWGKLLGLDRVPEARTLRQKIRQLSNNKQAEGWSAEMSKQWLNREPSFEGLYYVDGHVRVYHGSQTKLPRHYVSRDKLCARAICDYWVNAFKGAPFFYVTKVVDPGIIQTIENDIVPRLEKEISNQPTKEELQANPLLPRFTIIVDREGYSPKFIKRLWDKRIAFQTYCKHREDTWDVQEFKEYQCKTQSGETLDLKLAERGTLIGAIKNRPSSRASAIWVREIRRLKDNSTQGSMVSTNFNIDLVGAFVNLISRWSQENFFGYMQKEYGLDRLIDYGLEELSETVKITNPKYRTEDSEVRKYNSRLNRLRKRFGEITLDEEIDPEAVSKYEQKKGELLKEIRELEELVAHHKLERKKHPKHVLFKDLDEEAKFKQLRSSGKHLIDTIKLVAYRAETSMASIVKEKMPFHERSKARVFLRDIFNKEADLLVDDKSKTLTVRLHHLANQHSDEIALHLCNELNSAEIKFPGTDYRVVYELVS